MGFGGGYSTPNMPMYIKPAEPNNDIAPLEYKGEALLRGYKYDKDCLANFLLQCGHDENEIRIMLQYVFWELQDVDFEDILASPTSSPFCTLLSNDPVSKLCCLAKQMHEADLTHAHRLQVTKDFLALYTNEQLLAIMGTAEYKKYYDKFLENSPTGKKLTEIQCQDTALFFALKHKIGEASLIENGYKPLQEEIPVKQISPALQNKDPLQIWEEKLHYLKNTNPTEHKHLLAYFMKFWEVKQIIDIENEIGVKKRAIHDYVKKGRSIAISENLPRPLNDKIE